MIKIKKNVLMDLYFKGAYINEQETTGGGADAGNYSFAQWMQWSYHRFF